MATSSLQDRRVWIGGGVAVAVLIAAATWFLLISPERSAAASLHAQAADQRAQNSDTAQKVAELKAKSAHLPAYIASLRAAMDSLPSDSGLAAYTRQVHAFSAASRVAVDGITVGQIAPAVPIAVTTPTDGSTPSTSTSSSTTSGSTTPSSASPSATPVPGTAPTGATAGALYALPITVVSEGKLAAQQNFLEDLRSAGPRYGLVTSVQFAPAAGTKEASIDADNTMTTQVTVFSEPLTSDQLQSLNKLLHGDIGS